MRLLFELFLTFMKIGLFTFGGGPAMLPFITSECVEKKKWITQEEMTNVIIVAQSTPGPVSINCATYVGYRQKGIIGAFIATLGMILPSFIIIILIALFLDNLLEIQWIANAFKGIKLAVGILIMDAAIKMLKKMNKNAFSYIVLILSTIAILLIDIFALNFSSIFLMLIAGVISLSIFIIQNKKNNENKEVEDNDLS